MIWEKSSSFSWWKRYNPISSHFLFRAQNVASLGAALNWEPTFYNYYRQEENIGDAEEWFAKLEHAFSLILKKKSNEKDWKHAENEYFLLRAWFFGLWTQREHKTADPSFQTKQFRGFTQWHFGSQNNIRALDTSGVFWWWKLTEIQPQWAFAFWS